MSELLPTENDLKRVKLDGEQRRRAYALLDAPGYDSIVAAYELIWLRDEVERLRTALDVSK